MLLCKYIYIIGVFHLEGVLMGCLCVSYCKILLSRFVSFRGGVVGVSMCFILQIVVFWVVVHVALDELS